jgi:hypothetical protein
MCWKCAEIDKVIFHYRTLIGRITDRLSLAGLDILIEKLEDEKKSLHPEQRDKKNPSYCAEAELSGKVLESLGESQRSN